MASGGHVEYLLELVLDAPAERTLIGRGNLTGQFHRLGEQGFHFGECFPIQTVREAIVQFVERVAGARRSSAHSQASPRSVFQLISTNSRPSSSKIARTWGT